MEKVKKWEQKLPKRDLIARLIRIFMPNWERASVTQGAAEMAYFILLSLMPILLIIANLIPLLPMETAEVLDFAQSIVPSDIYSLLEPTIATYLESASGGAISIGAIAALWSASKIVTSLRRVLDEVYGTIETKNFLIDRILSVLVILGIVLVIGFAVFLFVFGEQIVLIVEGLIGMELPLIQQFLQLRWVILALILFFVFVIIYQFVPNHHLEFKYSLPGAIFSTLGGLILSQFFSLYITYAGGDAIANATFGAFIILMLFLYFSSMIVLLGGLVNVIVYEWGNNKSVHEYEKEYQRLDALEGSHWTGYPTEEDSVILKRKLYKVNELKQAELEDLDED